MYALQLKVQLIVDQLNAYENAPEIRPVDPVDATSSPPAVSEQDDKTHPAELLPYYVEDIRKSLPGSRLPTAARKLWHTLIGSSRERAEEARDHAGEFADWLVANYLTQQRLVIDLQSKTLVLDGQAYSSVDPTALALLKFLQEHPGQKFSASELQQHVPGLKGDESRIRRVLDTLDPTIRECVKGKRGTGRWLQLPPRPF